MKIFTRDNSIDLAKSKESRPKFNSFLLSQKNHILKPMIFTGLSILMEPCICFIAVYRQHIEHVKNKNLNF